MEEWQKILCNLWWRQYDFTTDNEKFNAFIHKFPALRIPNDVYAVCWDLLISEGIQKFQFIEITNVFNPTFPLKEGDLVEVPTYMDEPEKNIPWFQGVEEIITKLTGLDVIVGNMEDRTFYISLYKNNAVAAQAKY